jgi:AraC family transcriptional regulator, regulatory protein of adaptative response / methylphosphotriester-DNA alkyltransferase methyltransferase
MMQQTGKEAKADQAIPSCHYYGVKTTGIFCLPSCKSKAPLPENVVLFDTCEDAVRAGFRPCKRCRPDLHACQPNEQLLLQFKDDIDRGFKIPECLDILIKSIPVSPSHLVRLFKGRFGCTPHEYVRMKRLALAQRLLQTTGLNVADVAARCGFTSYTAFYTSFKRFAGATPGQYRGKGSL